MCVQKNKSYQKLWKNKCGLQEIKQTFTYTIAYDMYSTHQRKT